MRRWLGVCLALLGTGFGWGAGIGVGAGTEVTRRLELLFPGRYRLTMKRNRGLAVRVTDPALAPLVLDVPGDSVEFGKADRGEASTWHLGFGTGPRGGSACDLELEEVDGILRIPFSVNLQAMEPRIRVTLPPGTFDSLRVIDSRSYFIKGAVTLVQTTGDQDVLIAITE